MDYEFPAGTKINIISIFFPPETGAAASRIFKMATALNARGADVEVITALPNYPTGRIFEQYQGRVSTTENIKGIIAKRYWIYPSNSSNPILRILNMLSFSASMFLALPYLWRRKPDTIIINTPPLLAGFSGVLLSKMVGARTVVNVSDIWPLSALELGAIQRGRFYSLLEWIETFIYKRADKLLVQSDETKNHILKVTPEAHVEVYRNLDQKSPFVGTWPSSDADKFKIVYAGLLGVAQGVLDICQNIDFNKLDIELHIYGDGNERSEIERYISENNDCNIYLHNMVPKEDIPEILSNFHATIIPLKKPIYGAFPSKLYMAISSGLPVIFCGEGGGAEFVREYNIGWVSPSSDSKKLFKNLQSCRSMAPKDYERMKNHIIDLANHEFDLEEQANYIAKFIAS